VNSLAFWIALFAPLLAFGQNPSPQPSKAAETFPDLTTLSGMTYKAVRIQTIDRDGITFFYAGGAVNIPFEDLPEEYKKFQAVRGKEPVAANPGTASAGSAPTATPASDPLGGGVVAGFTDDSVLLRMPNGSLVGKKLKELDAATLARIQASRPQPTAASSGRSGK
jgi:hypothetical protein